MNCTQCGASVPAGAAVCPSCRHAMDAPSATAVGALTPPDGPAPHTPTTGEVDELAVRLQAAIGEAYRVEKALGAGGFAVVYLVRDLNLKRKLAVKVLSPDLITSRTVLERFRREAETVAQLSHPHIVPLHFIGQKDDLVYLAMECIEGGSLADRIEQAGKLAPEEAARYLGETASALAYAHKRGVVHRDIKPHNVLIEAETGRSLVTDFGIARTAESGSLTASGMLVGTPAYLAPEQVTGGASDHRADIYALGVMAFEMLTGQPPFTGPTPTVVLMKRLSEAPPPLARLRPDAPQVLRDVVDGCLAQDPDERFQNAADIVRALGGATPVSGQHGTAEIVLKGRRRRTRRNAIIAASALLVLGAAAVALGTVGRGAAAARVPPVDSGMVVIPGGTYTIGVDAGPDMNRPPHQVAVDAFGIDTAETSVGEYRRYIAAQDVPVPWTGDAPDDRLPVTGVLFGEASNYCLWRHPDGGRLPTEVEWEAAARGADGRLYPWGDAFDLTAANTLSARRDGPAPVATFPRGRTPRGVYDLVGNVWEWTRSTWTPYPGSRAAGDSSYYVIRGGAYNSPDAFANAAHRGAALPSGDRRFLAQTGFRCVMPVRPDAP